MEYFLGAALSIAAFIILSYAVKNKIPADRMLPIKYSQSYIYSLMSPFMPSVPLYKKRLSSQSQKYLDNHSLRVFFDFEHAYWIKDNRLYRADLEDGMILPETQKEVDTIAMSKVELNKIMFIVEKLTEGDLR